MTYSWDQTHFFSTTSHFHQYFFPSGKEFLENTKILGIVNEKNLFGPKVGSHKSAINMLKKRKKNTNLKKL